MVRYPGAARHCAPPGTRPGRSSLGNGSSLTPLQRNLFSLGYCRSPAPSWALSQNHILQARMAGGERLLSLVSSSGCPPPGHKAPAEDLLQRQQELPLAHRQSTGTGSRSANPRGPTLKELYCWKMTLSWVLFLQQILLCVAVAAWPCPPGTWHRDSE